MSFRLIRDRFDSINLPDEIIEQICGYISPIQLCLSGWERVSKGFSALLSDIYASCEDFNTVSGINCSDFFVNFKQPSASTDLTLVRKLKVVIKKIFPHVVLFTLDAADFSAILHWIEENEPLLLLPKLRALHIFLGDNSGFLAADTTLTNLRLARVFANELKSVKITVNLSPKSEEFVTCCSFRFLLRFLMEITGSAGTWSLVLKDKTDRAQGWFCPSELSYYRNIAFISYVRTFLDLGLTFEDLQMVDVLKMSPYMIVMKKRRFLYMYDEFKQCKNLLICYDIGIVSPSFQQSSGNYPQLQLVEIISSHVLYKKDFLKYLSEATNIRMLRIMLPYHWAERVSRCKFGCFHNADYGCFMEYGWASISYYLPHASLVFC